ANRLSFIRCFLKPQTTPILHTSILISIEEPVHSADRNKKTRAVVRRGAKFLGVLNEETIQ
ncbi:MAG: hypothetical protein WA196_02680, partial [Pseudolabrys sp.]